MFKPELLSNRIDHCFRRLRERRRKALVAYITAGDPSLAITARLVHSFESAGVNLIELGVPFSDPLADGVVNQLAAARALKAGTTLAGILEMTAGLRRRGSRIPLVLFTYFNPIHHYGLERFVKDAKQAGIDGILNLDLPPEESATWTKLLKKSGLHSIHLIAPTTPPSRIAKIVLKAGGFIYYVSQEGVTGMRNKLAGGIHSRIQAIRRWTDVPIVVGFGISTPQQVKQAAEMADGCVVGSAIVQKIARLGKKASLVSEVTRFVKSLVTPLEGRANTPLPFSLLLASAASRLAN